MEKKYVLALDQGTTGSRAFIFDAQGKTIASHYKEFKQYFPKPGWVEHDADEIWRSCVDVIRGALKKSRISAKEIVAIGITNQRETTVMWDRKTSKPVAKAIVWQCRRTSEFCKTLTRHASKFRRKTGLVVDPYFSGTKIRWYLDHVKDLRQKAQKGDICFGTIDSWLIWKLTKGKTHATDLTNASRTLIFNIKTKRWDKELLSILKIPSQILPKVQNSGSIFGETANGVAGLPSGVPIASVLGDQQAALYGQGCFEAGTSKNTYGTGCFIVLNTGKKLIYSKKGLLSTIASDDRGKPVYAMEGSIFIAGAVVQWLRDQLKVIKDSSQTEKFTKDLKDTNGVYFVPAFTGLGAPYWDSEARGVICGLTRGSNIKHIIRAALESMAYQTKDVYDIMKREYKINVGAYGNTPLRVDGGACQNNFLMQFQADILNCSIVRPQVIDSTAYGVALLAGVTVGLFKGKNDLKRLVKKERVFKPRMSSKDRKQLYDGWLRAIDRTRSL